MKPTLYYTDEVHQEFTRVPPPVTVPPVKSQRRAEVILLAGMCAGLVVALVVVLVGTMK